MTLPLTVDMTVAESGQQFNMTVDTDESIDMDVGTNIVPDTTPEYEGPYAVTPSLQTQTLETEGLKMTDNVSVEPMPQGIQYYSPVFPVMPIITVDGNGKIRATVDEGIEFNPIYQSGYLPSSTISTATVIGSSARQLDTKTSADLVAVGDTVDVPAGYYPNSAQKSVDGAVWAAQSNVTLNPVISVDYDTGEITATNSGTGTVRPVSQSGYANANTDHVVAVTGNTGTQLMTLGATEYTPGATAQTIAAQQYLTGAQTIKAVAPPWYDMSGSMSWLGAGAEFVQTFTLADVKLSATNFASWTPSTTATDILATRTAGTFTATDMPNYDYYVLWETTIPIVYQEGSVDKAKGLYLAAFQVQQLIRRASSYANLLIDNKNNNVNVSAFTAGSFYRYYGTTQGTVTYTWSTSYGFYATVTANTFSSSTATSPTVTLKTPKVTARCSTTYLSTGNAALIDQTKTIISQKCKVYRVKKAGFMQGCYDSIAKLVQEMEG